MTNLLGLGLLIAPAIAVIGWFVYAHLTGRT